MTTSFVFIFGVATAFFLFIFGVAAKVFLFVFAVASNMFCDQRLFFLIIIDTSLHLVRAGNAKTDCLSKGTIASQWCVSANSLSHVKLFT